MPSSNDEKPGSAAVNAVRRAADRRLESFMRLSPGDGAERKRPFKTMKEDRVERFEGVVGRRHAAESADDACLNTQAEHDPAHEQSPRASRAVGGLEQRKRAEGRRKNEPPYRIPGIAHR